MAWCRISSLRASAGPLRLCGYLFFHFFYRRGAEDRRGTQRLLIVDAFAGGRLGIAGFGEISGAVV